MGSLGLSVARAYETRLVLQPLYFESLLGSLLSQILSNGLLEIPWPFSTRSVRESVILGICCEF